MQLELSGRYDTAQTTIISYAEHLFVLVNEPGLTLSALVHPWSPDGQHFQR
jgi:hypothetical protein